MISLIALALFFPSLLIGAIGSIYLKKSAKKFKINLKAILHNKDFFFGVFLSALSIFIYIFSLKYANLSMIYPLVSINYIFIAILSSKFLGEKITVSKALGIIFITLGSFFIIK
jgi:uncharacterized membrane protein